VARKSRLWRVVPYTFKTVWHVLAFLVARWLLRYVVVICWQAPSALWGWWVVLGTYALLISLILVYLHLLALERWLAAALLWFFASRWRWNFVKMKEGVRPLFERREDL